ncbi:MAG: homocysteine S-methyltransferase family protein, partial [Anaerovoracaceae bacterium]|nr:homocysteine S-methyltransferase family protein [Anaerovoracaceae bacterium]
MKLLDYMKDNIVYLDGGMGTLIQEAGLPAGEYPENWNITHPEVIEEIHRSYFDAGSNIVNTNTFGANSLKFSNEKLKEIIKSAIENASRARKSSKGSQEKYIALDIG